MTLTTFQQIVAALLLSISFTGGAPGAHADDYTQPHHGSGVFCTSLERAKLFVEKFTGGNAQEALLIVTAKFGEKSCGNADVLVAQTAQYDRYTNDLGTWQFVQVNVIAQQIQGVIIPITKQTTWYTAYKITEPVKGSSI